MALIEKAMPLSGGAGLNFSIVGGTEEPINPKENTIWINTDVAIGEYQFSSNEPITKINKTELQMGDVWIRTSLDTTYEFNAIKKDGGLLVSPTAIYQYIDNIWKNMDSAIYQNNTWNKFGYILFSTLGNINNLDSWATYKSDHTGHVSINTNGYLQMGPNGHSVNGFINRTPIDITGYSKMIVEVMGVDASNYVNAGLKNAIAQGTLTAPYDSSCILARKTYSSAGTYEHDISSLTGIYYFTVKTYAKVTNAVQISSVKFI